jgi:hypothetical protein
MPHLRGDSDEAEEGSSDANELEKYVLPSAEQFTENIVAPASDEQNPPLLGLQAAASEDKRLYAVPMWIWLRRVKFVGLVPTSDPPPLVAQVDCS